MAVRQGASDRHRVSLGGDRRAALQQGAKALDQLLRPVGQVGKRPLLDLAVLTEGLPQQDGGRRVTVGDGLDVHGGNYGRRNQKINIIIPIYMGTLSS